MDNMVVASTEYRIEQRRIGYSNKKKILIRDEYTCQKCYYKSLKNEVHHITPILYGGTSDLENMITLCSNCHYSAPNTKDEFEYYVSMHLPNKANIVLYAVKFALYERIKSNCNVDLEFLDNEFDDIVQAKWKEFMQIRNEFDENKIEIPYERICTICCKHMGNSKHKKKGLYIHSYCYKNLEKFKKSKILLKRND